MWALIALGVPLQHCFAADISKAARQTLKANFTPKILRKDVLRYSVSDWPYADLFHCGFPCQGFSSAGKGLGLADIRSSVVGAMLKLIKVKKFAMVLLENVRGLKERHPEVLKMLVSAMRAAGYSVDFRIINARFSGVPQNRERLILIGLRKSKCPASMSCFQWPKNLPEVGIRSILDPRTKKEKSRERVEKARPRNRLGAQHVDAIYSELKQEGLRPSRTPMVIDIFSSRANGMHNVSPCLTKTRAEQGGHWISLRGRQFTDMEMRRLMGFPKALRRPSGLTDREWYGLLGNAIPVPVLQRVLARLLPFSGWST